MLKLQSDQLDYQSRTPRTDFLTLARLLIPVLLVGNMMLALTVFRENMTRRQEPKNVMIETSTPGRRPVVWLPENLYMNVTHAVADGFAKKGYKCQRENKSQWDVLWSRRYPFQESQAEVYHAVMSLNTSQKVNHHRCIGIIGHKANFITRIRSKYVPVAFVIPKQKQQLLAEIQKNPNRWWVQKNPTHRGTVIKTAKDLDVNSQQTRIVQKFIANPLLVDGRAFTLGFFVIISSVNPLRVYTLDEMLLKFCKKDYYPLELTDMAKFITGERSYAWEMPSMAASGSKHGLIYSYRHQFNSFIRSLGKDPSVVYEQVYDSIKETFTGHRKNTLQLAFKAQLGLNAQGGYFEMMRWDFMVDDNLQLYLLEANMSPNQNPNGPVPHLNINRRLIHNVITITGLPKNFVPESSNATLRNDIRVKDSDISVLLEECFTDTCTSCRYQVCNVCQHCLSEHSRAILKETFREHIDRGHLRRVIPAPNREKYTPLKPIPTDSPDDTLIHLWYKLKCLQDSSWCQ